MLSTLYAVALAETRDAAAGLAALDVLPSGAVAMYQPHWALRAYLLRPLGRVSEAAEVYAHAIGLSEEPAGRAFLAQQSAAVARG